MGSKQQHKIKNEKNLCRCQYCGKLGGNTEMIHEKCAIEYLKKKGFTILTYRSIVEILEGVE